jgi:hypothetical protein
MQGKSAPLPISKKVFERFRNSPECHLIPGNIFFLKQAHLQTFGARAKIQI